MIIYYLILILLGEVGEEGGILVGDGYEIYGLREMRESRCRLSYDICTVDGCWDDKLLLICQHNQNTSK